MKLIRQEGVRFIVQPGDDGGLRPSDLIAAAAKMPNGWVIDTARMRQDGSISFVLVEATFTEVAQE